MVTRPLESITIARKVKPMPTITVTKFKDLGSVIRAVRQSRGVRQEDLSESLGFSRDYLREIESGKPSLLASRLFRTLNKLGIRVTVTYDLPKQQSHGEGLHGDSVRQNHG